MPRTFLTPQEYARHRGMNLAELQRLMRDGTIKTVPVGDERLIPVEETTMTAQQALEQERWIPLSEAIAQHPEVDEPILRKLVKDGVIPSKTPPDSSEALVDREEFAAIAGRLDRRQWEHLRGQKIAINAAAKKYGLHSPTLLNWIRGGNIRVLDRDTYRVYLDEADVSFARALFEVAGKQGRALFPGR